MGGVVLMAYRALFYKSTLLLLISATSTSATTSVVNGTAQSSITPGTTTVASTTVLTTSTTVKQPTTSVGLTETSMAKQPVVTTTSITQPSSASKAARITGVTKSVMITMTPSQNVSTSAYSVASSMPSVNVSNVSETPTAATTLRPVTIASNQTSTTQTSRLGMATPTYVTKVAMTATASEAAARTGTTVVTQPTPKVVTTEIVTTTSSGLLFSTASSLLIASSQPVLKVATTEIVTTTSSSLLFSTQHPSSSTTSIKHSPSKLMPSTTTEATSSSFSPTSAVPPVGPSSEGGTGLVPIVAGAVAGVVVIVVIVILVLIFWKRCSSSASGKEDGSLLQSVRRLNTVEFSKGIVNIGMENHDSDPVDDSNTYSALYQFKATNEEEIDLEPQDTVQVIERSDSGWWRGTVSGGRTGRFPAEYVEHINSQQPKSPVTVVSTPKEAMLLASAEQQYTTFGVTNTTETRKVNTSTLLSPTVTPIEVLSVDQPSVLVAAEPSASTSSENVTTLVSSPELEAPFTDSDQPIQSQIALASERTASSVEMPKAAPGMTTAIAAALAAAIKDDQDKKAGDGDVSVEPLRAKEPATSKAIESDPQQTTIPAEQPGVLYEAVYDYAALRDDELSLTFGDHIVVKEKGDDGWWRGTNNTDQTGWFPYNYVSIMEPDRLSESAQDSGVNSMADEEEGTEYRAVYPYEAHRDDEITLREGDVVLVFEAAESGWWRGSIGHQDGWFPGSYVEPIITDDVPDDKSYSTADSVIVDSVHSPVLKKPATDTQAAKSVGVHPEPGYVGELAGKLEKRPQTEVLQTAQQPIAEKTVVQEESSKPRLKAALPSPGQTKLPKTDESPSAVDNSAQRATVGTDTKTDLVTDIAEMQTTKSQDSQEHHPVIFDTTVQHQNTTPSTPSNQAKDEPSSGERPPSRPLLPKRTVRSKLVKLPQGGAVKKRTLATTVRPPPPNRALPPPPARELPSPPREKRDQAAAAKETIGMTKPTAATPKSTERRKPPAGAMPRVPTRRNLLLQKSQRNPVQLVLPATAVAQATTGVQPVNAMSKPARPPLPKTQPVVATATKDTPSETAPLKRAEVDEVASTKRSPSGQVLPLISKPSAAGGTSTNESRAAVQNPLHTSDKPAPAANKQVLNPNPVIRKKTALSAKPLPSDRPSVKPTIAEKPPIVGKDVAPQRSYGSKSDPVSPIVSERPQVTPNTQNKAPEPLLNPPQHQRLPRVVNPSLSPTTTTLASTEKEESQSNIKDALLKRQAQPVPKARSVVTVDKPRRPSKPHGLSNDENVRNQLNSEVQSTIQKTAAEPAVDTDSVSPLNNASQPTVLFVAPDHNSKSGLLKPLPKDTTEKKGDRKIHHTPEEKTTSLAKSGPEEKRKEPPAKPKPPVTRPPPPTTLSEPADYRSRDTKTNPLKEDRSVNPQPTPQKKQTVDAPAEQPKLQPRPKKRTGQTVVEEQKQSSPKAKPPRPVKPPVIKATESPSPKKAQQPENSQSSPTEKAVNRPHEPPPDSSSAVNFRPPAPRSVVKQNKPARPPAPSSNSTSKPERPPPPKSAESTNDKPRRRQSKPSTSQMKSNPLRKAIATYHAQRSDELTFNEGDLIVEVQPVDQHGWCKGKLTTTGEEGMYPGNFADTA